MSSSHCAAHELDQNVGLPDLRFTERLTLWAIRAWAAYHSDLRPVWWTLDRAFIQVGMPQALAPFDRMMSAVFTGLLCWPDIRCVRCPRLGHDEVLLLSVLADLQREDRELAQRKMQALVSDTAARIVCGFGREFVLAMEGAGLAFAPESLPGATARVPAPTATTPAAERVH